jgi:putative endonuclease
MPFFTYIIQSEQDQSFYIGLTSDLQQRLERHNAGLSNYTSGKAPWKLVYFEEYLTKTEALKREKFLKRMKNADFYRRLIESKNDDGLSG